MAEVCIKIPKQLEQEVKESGIKWSVLLKRLIKHLEEEKEMIDWSVKLQRAGRKGRYEELKKRGRNMNEVCRRYKRPFHLLLERLLHEGDTG